MYIMTFLCFIDVLISKISIVNIHVHSLSQNLFAVL